MSTFDGTVQEFPLIQIDYFRKDPDRPPPLACFLSHVHSDHLQGLESFRAPFIYCSAATRELLLRIEKYPHRMNFNKGILESRRLHYEHLYKLLRPIPLNTPTEIELTPRLSIRVTLFDANHCTGAVMFLIEGDGKAILYTGDIRSESWWVNSLVRNPILVPYTLGGKKLDKIYLDTTFSRADNLRHNFPSKADGLAELLGKVKNYPNDTIFYFRAWTFGYEEVWMALSAALNAKIHVNRYQLGLYRSVSMQARSGNVASEASALCGYELGNRFVPGCLSEDETCRLHSCESDLPCPGVTSGGAVYIEPIVSRLQDGSQLPEVGIGGGAGDLYQTHELELPDQTALEELEKLCHGRIHDNRVLSETRDVLLEAYNSKKKTLSLDSYGIKYEQDIPLEKLVTILSHGHSSKLSPPADMPNKTSHALPNKIQFPYSRHSSYTELCELVAAFTPKDVFPCTTDPLTWTEDTSIRSLFGHLCSGNQFSHDIQMRDIISNDKELLRLRSRKRARSEERFSPRSSQVSGSSFMVDSGPRVCDSFESSTSEPARNVAAKPVTADVNFSSSSSTARNLLPSSLESIPEYPRPVTTTAAATATTTTTTTGISDPLTPIDHTTEVDRVKRNKIRHARQFLQSNLPYGMVSHLGPLPSSWPTEERDGFNPLLNDENGNRSGSEAIKGDEDGDNGGNNSLPSTTSHSPSPPNSPSHNPDNNASESQLTNTLSVSDSAFAPSFSSQDQDQDQAQAQAQSYGGGGCDDGHQETISSRNRKAAYLAARADSFDAWGFVALGSAGNNHTEEEIEL